MSKAISARPMNGREAYEADVLAMPLYLDGTPRKRWAALDAWSRLSWERNPTPRGQLRLWRWYDTENMLGHCLRYAASSPTSAHHIAMSVIVIEALDG